MDASDWWGGDSDEDAGICKGWVQTQLEESAACLIRLLPGLPAIAPLSAPSSPSSTYSQLPQHESPLQDVEMENAGELLDAAKQQQLQQQQQPTEQPPPPPSQQQLLRVQLHAVTSEPRAILRHAHTHVEQQRSCVDVPTPCMPGVPAVAAHHHDATTWLNATAPVSRKQSTRVAKEVCHKCHVSAQLLRLKVACILNNGDRCSR